MSTGCAGLTRGSRLAAVVEAAYIHEARTR
jgi:hypothetical protein